MNDLPVAGSVKYGFVSATALDLPFFTGGQRPVISLIMPTLNNAPTLPSALSRVPGWVDEIILVDGRSTDGSVYVARAVRPDVKVVIEARSSASAILRTGFQAARGDIIILCRADGSMDPAESAKFVGALLAGADYVKGSRFLHGGRFSSPSRARRFGHRVFAQITRRLFGGAYTDPRYRFIAFWSRVLLVLDLEHQDFEVETILNVQALRTGLRVIEIPSAEAGRSRVRGLARGIRDGWHLFKLFLRQRTSPHKNRVRAHWTWNAESPIGFDKRY